MAVTLNTNSNTICRVLNFFHGRRLGPWLFLALPLLLPAWTQAQVTVYRDEQAYLAALQNQGLVQSTDGFENTDDWGLMQIFSESSVTSHGVDWASLGTGIDVQNGIQNGGDWGLSPAPASTPFNGLVGTNTGNQTMFAAGGWVRGGFNNGSPTDVFLYLNGDHTTNWLDDSVGTTPQFFGVISSSPITSFEFSTQEVAPGDNPKLIYLDDFTGGFDMAPSIREPAVDWNNAAGGSFGGASNWTGGTVPAATQNVRFNLHNGALYSVTLAQNRTLGQAIVADDQVALDLGGNMLTLSEPNITHESLIVGEIAGDSGQLTIQNGVVSGANAVVAHSRLSNGSLTVQSGGQLNLSGHLRIGSGGTGDLQVLGGGTVSSDFSVLGMFGGTGSATIDGAGSAWDAGTTLNVGMAGTGTLNVSNGGRLSAKNIGVSVKLGNGLPSDVPGSGSITVTNGELANTNFGSVTLGADGGIGSLTLDGSTWTGGAAVYVGRGGQGTLTIGNGSTATLNTLVVGEESASSGSNPMAGTGTVAIDGAGTVVNATQVTVGKTGSSSLAVTGGAQISGFSGEIGVGADSQASLTGPGTNWTLTGTRFSHSFLSVGAGDQVGSFFSSGAVYKSGSLTVDGGATINTEDLYVGTTRTGLGHLVLSGAGTTFTATQSAVNALPSDSYIGYLGDGVVDVINGAHLQTDRVFVGRFGIRNLLKGEVNVVGPGSSWDANTQVYIGFNNNGNTYNAGSIFFSEGTVNVTQGATASALSVALGTRRLSRGTLNIDGPGSTFTVGNQGVLFGNLESFGSGANFSFEGEGALNVSNGGWLNATGSDINVQFGTIDLTDGTITAANVFLKDDVYSSSDPAIARLIGNGTVQGNVVVTGGSIAPGHSAGTLLIDGDLSMSAGTLLLFEIGGQQQGTEYDFMDVTGNASLSGILDVSLINGFSPLSGDTFDILTAASIDPTGLAWSGPSGLMWQVVSGGRGQILQLQTSAVPEPAGLGLLATLVICGLLVRRRVR